MVIVQINPTEREVPAMGVPRNEIDTSFGAFVTDVNRMVFFNDVPDGTLKPKKKQRKVATSLGAALNNLGADVHTALFFDDLASMATSVRAEGRDQPVSGRSVSSYGDSEATDKRNNTLARDQVEVEAVFSAPKEEHREAERSGAKFSPSSNQSVDASMSEASASSYMEDETSVSGATGELFEDDADYDAPLSRAHDDAVDGINNIMDNVVEGTSGIVHTFSHDLQAVYEEFKDTDLYIGVANQARFAKNSLGLEQNDFINKNRKLKERRKKQFSNASQWLAVDKPTAEPEIMKRVGSEIAKKDQGKTMESPSLERLRRYEAAKLEEQKKQEMLAAYERECNKEKLKIEQQFKEAVKEEMGDYEAMVNLPAKVPMKKRRSGFGRFFR